MLTCDEIREEFSALLDDELTPEVRDLVQAHLSQCADCLRLLGKQQRVDRLYRQLPKVQTPANFEDAVKATVRPRLVWIRPRLLSSVLRAAPALAAAILLLAAGLTVWRFQPLPAPEQTASTKSLPEGMVAVGEMVEQLQSLGYLDAEERVSEAPADKAREPAPAPAASPAPFEDGRASYEPQADATLRKPNEEERIAAKSVTALLGGAGVVADREVENASVPERELALAAPVPAMAQPATDTVSPTDVLQEKRAAPAPRPIETAAQPTPPPAPMPSTQPAPLPAPTPPAQPTPPPAPAMAAPPAPTPPPQPAKEIDSDADVSKREIGGRTFLRSDDGWRQAGYRDQKCVVIRRESSEFNAILERFPRLRPILEDPGIVFVEIDARWCEIVPSARQDR